LQTDVIYTHFSKAFDSVNHSLLLFKLDQLEFPNNLLTWISSYLNGRSQRVLFKNTVSKMINVTSGVPQGSHLGPLLFTLFINDLPSIVNHSRVLMYADDVKLCFSYNNIEFGFCLQSDINRFQEWCQYNLLNLNCLKCNVMAFYRGTPTFMSYSFQNMSLDRICLRQKGVSFQEAVSSARFIQMSTSRALALPSALPLHLSPKSPLCSGALKLS